MWFHTKGHFYIPIVIQDQLSMERINIQHYSACESILKRAVLYTDCSPKAAQYAKSNHSARDSIPKGRFYIAIVIQEQLSMKK